MHDYVAVVWEGLLYHWQCLPDKGKRVYRNQLTGAERCTKCGGYIIEEEEVPM